MLRTQPRDRRGVFVQLVGGLAVVERAAEPELADHAPEGEGDDVVGKTFKTIVERVDIGHDHEATGLGLGDRRVLRLVKRKDLSLCHRSALPDEKFNVLLV
jgi:hypothetical protein